MSIEPDGFYNASSVQLLLDFRDLELPVSLDPVLGLPRKRELARAEDLFDPVTDGATLPLPEGGENVRADEPLFWALFPPNVGFKPDGFLPW